MKVFIAGPIAVKELNNDIIFKLQNICQKNYEILVGDANGIDSCVQMYLHQKSYKNVTVFASSGIARNNYGNWKIENVEVENGIRGFDFYKRKDLEMAKKADIGFMIWNGESKGTFNNMLNILSFSKEVVLYYLPNNKFYVFRKMSDFKLFLMQNVKLNKNLKNILYDMQKKNCIQSSLF